MPTSGTHITVVEQLAINDNEIKSLIGDPFSDSDTHEGIKMRFAKLGSIGPDVFYMLGDFNLSIASGLQDLENFLIKVGGTTVCIRRLSEKINKLVIGELDEITEDIASEIQETSYNISRVITNGFLALLVDNGVNVWSLFRSPRQQDLPREKWFWADYLHYAYTGDFTKQLLLNAKSSGDENLYAYSLGYLTHYITDIVGHPYVNQVVQSPFRLHWQRHHLVENFIDTYVWDRWHIQRSQPDDSDEAPLDVPTFRPNRMDDGAPYLSARLHDHIDIGKSTVGDPVDAILDSVCNNIKKGLFDIGILEDLNIEVPDNPSFKDWCGLMVKTIRDVYSEKQHHPNILECSPDSRPNGFPLEEDVAGAYGVLRLLLKISTENDVEEPEFPNDIVEDITSAIEQIMQSVTSSIGGIPPVPVPNTNGSFSPNALNQALADIIQWVAEVVEGVAKVVSEIIQETPGLLTNTIKMALWLLNSAIYTLYQYTHNILLLNAYSAPFTAELIANIGGVNMSDIWITKGELPKGSYPAEENPIARQLIGNTYCPFIAPNISKIVEMPPVLFAAPYCRDDRPDAFLNAPIGPDNMFENSSMQISEVTSTRSDEQTFTSTHRNFGGAIQNSAKAIHTFEAIGPDLILPNFDMDSDRGYAWPNWHVNPEPDLNSGVVGNPLDPDPENTGTIQRCIHVNAVRLED